MQYARYLDSRLKNSDPTAHAADRLVLLGSPPDTVHGATLRGTGLSSLLIQGRQHTTRPGAGIHPRFSGLRVQGTAISPTSAALLRAEARNRATYIVLHCGKIGNQNFSSSFPFSPHLLFLCRRVTLVKKRKGASPWQRNSGNCLGCICWPST